MKNLPSARRSFASAAAWHVSRSSDSAFMEQAFARPASQRLAEIGHRCTVLCMAIDVHSGTGVVCVHSSVPSESSRRFFCDGTHVWFIDHIWEAARALTPFELIITEVRELDEVVWFSDAWGRRPTCRAVVEHARRVNEADLSYPVVINSKGQVLDGMHRVAKAMLAGLKTVGAVRLMTMPEPDELLDSTDPRFEAPLL